MTGLDEGLVSGRWLLTAAELVEVWSAHCPPHSAVPAACAGCGHVYTREAVLCPTEAVVRTVIAPRRFEVTAAALSGLTYSQQRDLFDRTLSHRTAVVAARHPAAEPPALPVQLDLLELLPAGPTTARPRPRRRSK